MHDVNRSKGERLRRKLFTLLAAISLLLCVATAFLWVRSYWRSDGVFHRSYSNHHAWLRYIGSSKGLLLAGSYEWLYAMNTDIGPPGWEYSGFDATWTIGSLGFGYAHQIDYDGEGAYRQVYRVRRHLNIPHWSLSILAMILPVAWLRHQRDKVGAGCCAVCGYDLRATPERCPECGAFPASSTSSASSGQASSGQASSLRDASGSKTGQAAKANT